MTGLAIKPGADLTTIAPAGYCILSALKTVARRLGMTLTVTSGCDGEHSGPDDPHHLGEAYDVRSHDLLPEVRNRVVAAVMGELGWECFYGFLEAAGTSNEHFHFQRRKDTVFVIEAWLTAA